MDIMWKSPLLTADKRISAREVVGNLGGGKWVGGYVCTVVQKHRTVLTSTTNVIIVIKITMLLLV